MNTKTLSPRSLSVIDQYLNFKVGNTSCSVPYFNNKTTQSRLALRVNVGKGSPQDIYDEVKTLLIKSHVGDDSLTTESLKKVLVDQNLGIDCSGFVYYVLNAESLELKKGSLDTHISFVNCKGLFGKIRAKLRPVENCAVSTFAHDKNSSVVATKDILPGDIITMLSTDGMNVSDNSTLPSSTASDRDHVLVIHQVEYQNFSPIKIHYSHAIAYPEDGVYGTGIKQGTIEILDVNKSITEQQWIENGMGSENNRIFVRAKKSKTEVRRVR